MNILWTPVYVEGKPWTIFHLWQNWLWGGGNVTSKNKKRPENYFFKKKINTWMTRDDCAEFIVFSHESPVLKINSIWNKVKKKKEE